jgi:hypothetical protein
VAVMAEQRLGWGGWALALFVWVIAGLMVLAVVVAAVVAFWDRLT